MKKATEKILKKVKNQNNCNEFIPYGFTPKRKDCFGVSIVVTSSTTGHTQLIDKTYTIKTGKLVSSEIIEDYFK
tara:strand:+ start:104 stop:325 length:222 start_codon:yes stop_codon:yes gene_type:complete